MSYMHGKLDNFSARKCQQLIKKSCDKISLNVSDPSKVIRTGLTVNSDEFDRYSVTQDTEVTFCLNELRVRPYLKCKT